MKWSKEFDDSYQVPAVLTAHDRFEDESWRNDMCPSFAVRGGSDAFKVVIWVEHPEQAKRELLQTRYLVAWQSANMKTPSGVEVGCDILHTDDVNEAIAKALAVDQASQLADKFSALLKSWIGDKLAEVVKRNEAPFTVYFHSRLDHWIEPAECKCFENEDAARSAVVSRYGKVVMALPGGDFTVAMRHANDRRALATIQKRGNGCASHDFCDANEAMLQAFAETFNRSPLFLEDTEGKPELQKQAEEEEWLFNYAWSLARARKFNVEVAK